VYKGCAPLRFLIKLPLLIKKKKSFNLEQCNFKHYLGSFIVSVCGKKFFWSWKLSLQILQTPKATIEVKELKVDISKDGGSKPNLFVKLRILPIFVHIGEPRSSCDQSSNFNSGGCISAGQSSFPMIDRSSTPISCEELSLSCEFGHDRYFFYLCSFL
jgi:hypothetical protein